MQYNGLGARVKVGTVVSKRDGVDVTDPLLVRGSDAYVPGVSERSGGVTKFVHTDYLGSARLMTDASGAVTDSWRYEAYGNVKSHTGPSTTKLSFARQWGYQQDSGGLQLLGHRYYESDTGVFLSRDPALDGSNWFGYVRNNPGRYIDASGLNLTIIGDNQGINKWDWSAEHLFGTGGSVLRQPSKKDVIDAIINEPAGSNVMIWGHGGPGYIWINGSETITEADVRYINAERTRRGKGKLNAVWLRSCDSCRSASWINSWLGISDEVNGFTTSTKDGPIQGWSKPVGKDPKPNPWWWASGSKSSPIRKKGKGLH